MSTVTVREAKARLAHLVDRAARGEVVIITRHHKAVARLVPEAGPDLSQVRAAVAELRAGRALMARRRGFKPLTDAEINRSIEEGRP